MNWIRKEKRLAIHLRDGCACAYCNAGIEQEGIILSLDHLTPHSKGGSNTEKNLVTCCKRCNDSRGNRPLKKWIAAVAHYVNHGATEESIAAHVKQCVRRPLDVTAAKELIARRGYAAALLSIS